MRGFFGIGIYHCKTEKNIGTLWRTAYLYDAKFIFTIGRRYNTQPSDTPKAWKTIPLWEFQTFEEFKNSMPKESHLICVELAEKSKNLKTFVHPERAIYLLGAEDHGLPETILNGHTTLQIPSAKPISMNVSTAGSIIMYDRFTKGGE